MPRKLLLLTLSAILLVNQALPAFAQVPGKETLEKQPAKQSKGVPTVAQRDSVQGRTAGFGEPYLVTVPEGGTLLNEVGLNPYPGNRTVYARWKKGSSPMDRLHWAESLLSPKQEPALAEEALNKLIASKPETRVVGLAKRAKAFSLFYQGRYRAASDYLLAICADGSVAGRAKDLQGFQRHAEACAQYHEAHGRLGIYQPGRTDPLCGVRSAARSLQRFGLPYDEAKVAKVLPHTGMGSSTPDIVGGLAKLGFRARTLTGRPEIIRDLPLPAIVRVEHDHFIAVISADSKGVAYWCVDCHGEQRVTWSQWNAMEPDCFMPVTKEGTSEEALLELALTPGISGFASLTPGIINPFASLAGTQSGYPGILFFVCGARPQGLPCYGCPPVSQPCATAVFGADPLNAASGGEEYMPGPDLQVYNPTGPSVSWGREYFSIGNPVENGFGNNWSYSYNLVVNRWGEGGDYPGSPPKVDLVMPNSGHIQYTMPTGSHVPDASHTADVQLVPVEQGAACIVTWKWDASISQDYFEIKLKGEATIRTTGSESYPRSTSGSTFSYVNPGSLYRIASITDQVGRSIKFQYQDFDRTYTLAGSGTLTYPVRVLTSITDDSNVALLTLSVGTDALYTAATDRYGRKVVYTVQGFTSGGVPSGSVNKVFATTQASQIVDASASNPPARFVYGYSNESNGHSESIPTLHTISEPSPTGTGLSTTTLDYDSIGRVSLVTDGNGNKMDPVYASEGSAYGTRIDYKDPAGNLVEQYYMEFDAKMNLTQVRNDAGAIVKTLLFQGANPYRPTTVKDAYNRTWTYSWDGYGNLLGSTTPRSVTTTRTVSYAAWPLGRVTEVAEGSKTSTTIDYYSNGLVWKVNTPIPGESGTGNRQTTEYTYDSLGNVLTVVSPGNNAETAHTTTLNYTSDGSYSQSAKRGQPLTATNSNNETNHFRYDARGNTTSAWDPLGNTHTLMYNLADQVTDSYAPPTGNSGSGSARSQTVYLYTGGPGVQANAYNESGALVRTIDNVYGQEGETLSVSGSTEAAQMTYTPTYRTKTVDDGMGSTHRTTYTYNVKGQCTQIDAPGASGANFDRTTFTYDLNGRTLTRTDGRALVSTYAYNEPDGQLTSVSYSNACSVSLQYDAYGRVTSVTDSSVVGGVPQNDSIGTSVYDDLGLQSSASRTYKGLTAKTFTYTYFPDGSRASMVNPSGTWSYLYDKAGRYTSMVSPIGTVSSQYDAAGRQTVRTLPNGATTTCAFNAVGGLTSLVNRKQDNTIVSQWGSFAYDGAFNLAGATCSNNVGGSNFNGSIGYSYDTKDRLTLETSTRFSGYTENNVWDLAGNPTTFRSSSGRTYNVDNQRSNTGYAYDGNGNPTTYSGSSATYDQENRLTSLSSAYYSYGYRADGLRAWQQATNIFGPPTKRYYLYDGGQAVCELDTSGNVVATTVYAPDGLVGRAGGGQTRYALFDWQGNLAHWMTSSTAVSMSAAYTAWGQRNYVWPIQPVNDWRIGFGYNARWGYQRTSPASTTARTGTTTCQRRVADKGPHRLRRRVELVRVLHRRTRGGG
ncbi:MAG: hypothetical protein U0S12_11340 [Fimbriimonadales bacterium]